MNFDFTINLNFAFTFFNFLIYWKKINEILLHRSFIFVENLKMI